MKKRFQIERVGRRRRSAARGMARLGFSARVIAIVLRLKFATASEIVANRAAPAALRSPAERALFKSANTDSGASRHA
jgi:hypothetical protein